MANSLTGAASAGTTLRISSPDPQVAPFPRENPRRAIRRLDVSAWVSTRDDAAPWDELQAYLERVRRRLEHLDGRAFGAGSDHLIGIVVNADSIETAKAIWVEQVEPVIAEANPRSTVRLPGELRIVDVSGGALLGY